MQGNFRDALAASGRLVENVKPYVGDIPPLESFLPTTTLVLVRFRKWDEVLMLPEPAQQFVLTNAVWHWSRAMAFASKNQLEQGKSEQELFRKKVAKLPKGAEWGLNKAADILEIASAVLNSKFASGAGDGATAISELTKAVALEDALAYDEPPAWFLPARESLGGLLLRRGKFNDAEQVFRTDLQNNGRNGRSLFGLIEALK